MLTMQVRKLRQCFRDFQGNNDIKLVLNQIQALREASGGEQLTKESSAKFKQLRREDLRLICFDLLTAG